MIVDTSALIAIVFKEPGHEELIHKMSGLRKSDEAFAADAVEGRVLDDFAAVVKNHLAREPGEVPGVYHGLLKVSPCFR